MGDAAEGGAPRPFGAAAADAAAVTSADGSSAPDDAVGGDDLVSVIIPAHNAARWLPDALASVAAQTHRPLEACVCNDGSTDGTAAVAESHCATLADVGVRLVITRPPTLPAVSGPLTDAHEQHLKGPDAGRPAAGRGPGPARNAAVAASRGRFLCFLDADDTMAPDRVATQLAAARAAPWAIVGSGFTRDPPESTPRYTAWCNGLSDSELLTQRFRELTVIQPTWFMHRRVFDRVGGYPDARAEDLQFFYAHMEAHERAAAETAQGLLHDDVAAVEAGCDDRDAAAAGCGRAEGTHAGGPALVRVPRPLVTYRYGGGEGVSAETHRELIREIRVRALERQVLCYPPWSDGFGVWGAGKHGRAFYRLLRPEFQAKVTAFYDVDERKLGVYNDHGPSRKALVRQVPVRSVSGVVPPFVTCVSLDRTGGAFEANLAALGCVEGVDYFLFG